MSTAPSPADILDPSHPLAYLAYLPPSLAYELTIAVYVLVAALVVQIWDVLNNIHEDYRILVKRRLNFPSVVYCISRLSTLAYLLYATIYETAPIGNCERLSKVPPWLYCIAMSSTSLLFYFRVSAMYSSKYVSGFFLFMWLCVVGGTAVNMIGVAGYEVGPTKHCLSGTLKPFVSIGGIILLFNDTLVLIAISFRLMQVGMPEETRMKDVVRTVVFGQGLPAFTRALLLDGQIYYLSTISSALMTIVIFYIDSMPLVYRTIFGIPNLTLINVMACRVFRRTKSGKYRENPTIDLALPLSFIRESRVGNDNGDNTTTDMSSSMVFAISKDRVERSDTSPDVRQDQPVEKAPS